MVGVSSERKIIGFISEGICNKEVLECIYPDCKELSYECDLWEYKTGYVNGIEDPADAEFAVHLMMKQIVAFYNTYGGYIVIKLAIQDVKCAFRNSILKYDDLYKKLQSYVGEFINFKFHIEDSKAGEKILLIYVPKRSVKRTPAQFRRPSVRRGEKSAFAMHDVMARYGSETKSAHTDIALIKFLLGNRSYGVDNFDNFVSDCENNLPAKDPNLIQFIGRTDYIQQLWNWAIEKRNPIKVLTALGGIGKTSIAYEFCENIVQSGTETFDKIVWLTGKVTTYAAIQGRRVKTTRTDFESVLGFINELLKQVGYLDDETEKSLTIDDREELLIEALNTFSIFLVIDDVDSLSAVEQSELFTFVQRTFNQAVGSGSRSKCLLTSRLDLAAGAGQIIKVSGFNVNEAFEYAVNIINFLNIKIDKNDKNFTIDSAEFKKMYEISHGSPVFIASILNLVRYGEGINDALDQWKDRVGDDIRKYTFNKEIDMLSGSAIETLYVMQMLSQTNIDEIMEIRGVDRMQIRSDLNDLLQYHLYISMDEDIYASRLSTPEPIRLMTDIVFDRIPRARAVELQKNCAKKVHIAPVSDPISVEVRELRRIWAKNDFDHAEIQLKDARRRHPRSGDICYFEGRNYLKFSPPRLEDANESFEEAVKRGCSKVDVYNFLISVKFRLGLVDEIINRTKNIDELGSSSVVFCYRLVSLRRVANVHFDRQEYNRSAETFSQIAIEAKKYIHSADASAAIIMIRRIGIESAVLGLTSAFEAYKGSDFQLGSLQYAANILGYWYDQHRVWIIVNNKINEIFRDIEIAVGDNSRSKREMRKIFAEIDYVFKSNADKIRDKSWFDSVALELMVAKSRVEKINSFKSLR